MLQRIPRSLILLLAFSRFYLISKASSTQGNKSVYVDLNGSYPDRDYKGASLFCQDQTPKSNQVCHFGVTGTAICNRIPDYSMICMHGRVYIRDCYCATYNYQTDIINVGKCIYNCESKDFDNVDNGYSRLPQNISELNTRMCGNFHRNRTLCGRCEDTYYPMAFSYNMSCVKCQQTHWNWVKLASFVFVPLTLFCFIIIIFNINITSSYLQGFIFFSQAVSAPAMSRVIILAFKGKSNLLLLTKILSSFYSVWNLDILRIFSPSMCLHIDSLDILALDLVIGLYPLLIVIITHFMISLHDRRYKIVSIPWEPFRQLLHRMHSYFNIKTSLIDSFATVFVLSNIKLMSMCFDMLSSVYVYELSSSGHIHHNYGLYYDASTEVYSNKARAFMTHLVLTLFTIFPILLLLLYPLRCFQKLLNVIPFRWHVLHTFVDVFQGGYKNRSDRGTWDFRWFSSLLFILRFLIFLIYGFTLSAVFFSYAAILSVLIVLLLIIFQPFKSEQDGYVNCGFILLLSLWYMSITGMNMAQSKDVNTVLFFYGLCFAISILPILFLLVLLLLWIKNQMNFV